ncbi:MAG: hypothetical protein WD036_02825 [Bauldia sp.]
MATDGKQPDPAGADARSDERIEAARALLAAIDAKLFPNSGAIPFYEQALLIRRAVTRLLGNG